MRIPTTFTKGHGTGNDFVILADDEAALDLTPDQVQRISDRHTGIGCDGILRVVPTRLMADYAHLSDSAQWFMDYRNADGSIAEMCGNGVRVFAHFLVRTGRVQESEFFVATRGGIKGVRAVGADQYEVAMGGFDEISSGEPLTVSLEGRSWNAVGVALPNPHAVSFVDDLADLGEVLTQPSVSPSAAFPHGANFEFVVEKADRHVELRVHERGVGETLSCGTGACAVAWAARRRAGGSGDTTWRVDVPGGTVFVRETDSGQLFLTGPAVLTANGEFIESWWNAS